MQWVKTENSGMFVHTIEGKLTLWGPLTPEHPLSAYSVKKKKNGRTNPAGVLNFPPLTS